MQQIFTSARIAIQNIRANPLHTLLSLLGIVIGVAALVAILAFGDGLEQTGRSQLEKTTSIKNIAVTPRNTKTVDGIRVRIDDPVRFDPVAADSLESLLGERAKVDLLVRRSGAIQLADSNSAAYLIGSSHRAVGFLDAELKGSFFNENDYRKAKPVAVVSSALIKKIDPEDSTVIGQTVVVSGKEMRIIGIIQDDEMDPTVVMPLTALAGLFDDLNPALTIEAAEIEYVPELRDEIVNWLEETYEGGSEQFGIITYQQQAEQFKQGILLFKLVMGAITGISVLVGGIGIMNVLLISVTERTKEIGIRKATGAHKKDIVFQFLSESVTISLAGCALGWLTGMLFIFAFVPVVNTFVDIGFEAAVQPGTVLVVVAVALVIGVIFGTYPAYRAANLTPVDAIRHE